MNYPNGSSCPTPKRCMFTGCPGDCEPPRQAAVAPDFGRTAAAVALTEIAHSRHSDASLRSRDAHAHRRLLVASL